MQSMLHVYSVSSQLVSSIKDTFVESPNANNVTQIGMINSFWLNGKEIQGFPSAKPSVSFRVTPLGCVITIS